MRNGILYTISALSLILTLGAFSAGIASYMPEENNQENEMKIKAGDKAPEFTGTTGKGETISLKDYRGEKNVVLYFYPKDDTPGCTKEACSFRDNMKTIQSKNTVVLGVSVDDAESHRDFSEKYELNFTLIADPDHEITEMYGVKGKFLLKTIANRVTFLIDKEGVVRHVWPKVSVSGHTQEVIEKIEELGLDK